MARKAAVKIKRRKTAAALCSFMLLAGIMAGCGRQEEQPEEKTIVTMLYSNKFEQLEKLVEEKYPHIDLQIEINPYSDEQLRRLKNGVGPDLVVVSQPNFVSMQSYLMDISDTPASTAYEGTIMKSIKQDGKIFLLPLPGLYSGYVVNETLFEEAGIPLPENNKQLLEALTAMKSMGIGVGEDGTDFSVYSNYNSNLGMFFVGCMTPDFLGTMEGVQWLAKLQNKESTFHGVWEEGFSLLDAMIEAEVVDPAAISGQRNQIRYLERMGNGTQAVTVATSAFYVQCVEENKKMAEQNTAKLYSYRMLPFLSDEGNEPWLLFSPSAYIGINKTVSEDKKEACQLVLELISTEEGQDALIKDIGAGTSCLKDYQAKGEEVIHGTEELITSGYVYNVFFPDKLVDYLGSNARKVLSGKMTQEEALQSVDRYYQEGSDEVDFDLTVIGQMEEDLVLQNYNTRKEETTIGNFVTDCAAYASGAPIAVINGGAIRGSFYQGLVYGDDLSAVSPFDDKIVVLEMNGQTLWDMLENSLITYTDDFPGGRFLQVSGIHYTFDSSKPAGSRLMEVTLPDGTAIDRQKTYQVALNDYMAGKQGYAEENGDDYIMLNWYDETVPKGDVTLIKETGITYRDAMRLYFEGNKENIVKVQIEGRITDQTGSRQ